MKPPTMGRCHCGAVTIVVSRPPTDVTECRCSICLRYGALWAYYPTGEAKIDGPTEIYAWGRGHVLFHRCETCGCVVGWMPRSPDFPHSAINARMLDGFDPDTVTRIVEKDASM